jgi:hypothetical protein
MHNSNRPQALTQSRRAKPRASNATSRPRSVVQVEAGECSVTACKAKHPSGFDQGACKIFKRAGTMSKPISCTDVKTGLIRNITNLNWKICNRCWQNDNHQFILDPVTNELISLTKKGKRAKHLSDGMKPKKAVTRCRKKPKIARPSPAYVPFAHPVAFMPTPSTIYQALPNAELSLYNHPFGAFPDFSLSLPWRGSQNMFGNREDEFSQQLNNRSLLPDWDNPGFLTTFDIPVFEDLKAESDSNTLGGFPATDVLLSLRACTLSYIKQHRAFKSAHVFANSESVVIDRKEVDRLTWQTQSHFDGLQERLRQSSLESLQLSHILRRHGCEMTEDAQKMYVFANILADFFESVI